MKPFQRFLHFVVMKNVVPQFGKRDITSFMDLTYMDYLSIRRLVNLETFLTMCQLKRENGIWWLGTGEHRRRDDEIDAQAANEEEAVVDEVELQEEEVHDEAETQGESGSAEKFYDAEDEVQEPADVIVQDPTAPATLQPLQQTHQLYRRRRPQ
ncbi:hypothetical protein Dimus_036681 [Dionaea muscipula]